MFLVSIVTDPIAQALGYWLAELNVGTIVIRVLLVLVSATVLGIERANKRHAAGLRTFILVALTSAAAGLLDQFISETFESSLFVISAAAVIGIAIVSANTLLYSSKSQIKGLTTAIALWGSAFLGIAYGLGFYTVGLILSVVLPLVLAAMPKLEICLKDRSNHFDIHLELMNKTDLAKFVPTIRKLGLVIDDIEANPAYVNSGLSVYTITLSIYSKELKKYKTHSEIIKALETLDYVACVEEIH